MPQISAFFGITIQMFYGDHPPPHFHAEHQAQRATFDFDGKIRDSVSNGKATDSEVGFGTPQ